MNVYDINQLKVLRKTDIGYILVDENLNEVFLHFKETIKELVEDEEVLAFLFYDKHHRLTCTLKEVNVTISTPNFIKVKDINQNLGVFLENNCSKDLLLEKEYLPNDNNMWPQIGDRLFIKIKVKEKTGIARLCTKEDIISLTKKNQDYAIGEMVSAIVCKITSSGIGLISESFNYIFIHNTQKRQDYRLGEEVSCRILQGRSGDYNGSLLEQKEKMMDKDALLIIEYLNNHKGKMPFTAKTSSEEVENVFSMSKKAFKRALGGLYKDRVIEFDEEFTYLVKK